MNDGLYFVDELLEVWTVKMLMVTSRSIKSSSPSVLWNDLEMSLEKSDGFFISFSYTASMLMSQKIQVAWRQDLCLR